MSTSISAASVTPTSPASVVFTVVPSDTVELRDSVKAIYCTADGNLVMSDWSRPTPVQTTIAMVAGQQLNIRPRLILATGTTGAYLAFAG